MKPEKLKQQMTKLSGASKREADLQAAGSRVIAGESEIECLYHAKLRLETMKYTRGQG